MDGTHYSVQCTSRGATFQADDPTTAGQGGSLWWSWTAATSGEVTLTAGSLGQGLRLAVYEWGSLAALRPVAASGDGYSSTCVISFEAAEKQTYQIAVVAQTSEEIAINLSLSQAVLQLTSPLDGTVFAAPASLTLRAQMNGDGARMRRE